MFALTKSITKLAIVASSIAIVEGILWIILCLLGILIYFQAWTPIGSITILNVHDVLVLIFTKNGTAKMISITFLYFFISIIWVSISAHLLMNVKKKKLNVVKLSFMFWGGWTLLVCLYDVIVIGILVADYTDFLILDDLNVNLAFAILFSLAARGYVLWIVHLVFGIIILRYALTHKDDGSNASGTINAYDEERKKSFDKLGNWNTGFEPEPDRRELQRNDSYMGSSQGGYSRPRTLPKPHYDDHVAGIGRQRPMSRTNNFGQPRPPSNYIYPTQQRPVIPAPDYSPPISPLKPALRSNPFSNPSLNRQNNYRY